jgi:hypothetical protein
MDQHGEQGDDEPPHPNRSHRMSIQRHPVLKNIEQCGHVGLDVRGV